MQSYRVRSTAFYVVVGAALLVLVTKSQQHVLPSGLSSQIGHNSEALCFALLVAAAIQLTPVGSRSRGTTAALLGSGLALVVAGALLQDADLAPTLVTLNEPLIGAGLVTAYLAVPRPFPWAPLASLAVVVAIVVFFDTDVVLDQAESLVPLALAPLALDVFDRTILEPHREDQPLLRVSWIVALVAFALAAMALAPWARDELEGFVPLAVDYAQRAAEAYWGWVLLHLYFSYWLASRRDRAGQGGRMEATEGAR